MTDKPQLPSISRAAMQPLNFDGSAESEPSSAPQSMPLQTCANSSPLGSLGGLPAELRIMIYNLIVESTREPHENLCWIRAHFHKHDQSPSFPGLLLASKSIRKETLAIFYRARFHCFKITAARLPNLLLWLHQLAANLDRLGMRSLLRFVRVSIALESSHRASKVAMLAAARITRFNYGNAIQLHGFTTLSQYPIPRQLAPVVIARAIGNLSLLKSWTDEVLQEHVTFAHQNTRYLFWGPPGNPRHDCVRAAHITLQDGSSVGFAYLPKSLDHTGPVEPDCDESHFVLQCNSEMFLIRSESVYLGSLRRPEIASCSTKYCRDEDCWHHGWWKFAEKPLNGLSIRFQHTP